MIPLGLGLGGSLLVGPTVQTRRMWMCANSVCIHKIETNPKHLARALRGKPPPATDLRKQIRELQRLHISSALESAARDGMIVHGSQRVSIRLNENIEAIFYAADAGTGIRNRIADKLNVVSTYTIPFSRAEIGTLLGRGPRSVLALRPGRKTQSLLQTLRMWHSLG